jgi:hypothetical protein
MRQTEYAGGEPHETETRVHRDKNGLLRKTCYVDGKQTSSYPLDDVLKRHDKPKKHA